MGIGSARSARPGEKARQNLLSREKTQVLGLFLYIVIYKDKTSDLGYYKPFALPRDFLA